MDKGAVAMPSSNHQTVATAQRVKTTLNGSRTGLIITER
jgi:hypothetical protein